MIPLSGTPVADHFHLHYLLTNLQFSFAELVLLAQFLDVTCVVNLCSKVFISSVWILFVPVPLQCLRVR
jgi:hypothetical protein